MKTDIIVIDMKSVRDKIIIFNVLFQGAISLIFAYVLQ